MENHFGLLFSVAHRTEDGMVNGIVIHVAFSQETETNDVENEAFLHLRIAYLNLTEFVDTNGNGAFNAGTDRVVQSISLQSLTYLQPTYKTITDDNGMQGWEVSSMSNPGQGGLVLGVKADIFPQFAVVDSTIVPPTATKITTTIDHFPFGEQTSRVALQVSATSKSVIEHETSQTEERIRVRSATAEGFYSVSSTAIVDGVSHPVARSVQQVGRHWLINLAYPEGTSIVHDPILGFTSGTTPILTGSLLIGAALAAIAVFAVLVYAGRRQLARVFSPKPLPV